MSEASSTKQKLDEFRASLPPGDEHTEPTREMLRVTSYACNGAPDKQQALANAVVAFQSFGGQLTGFVYEQIIYTRDISDEELQQVNNYLIKKWKIKF